MHDTIPVLGFAAFSGTGKTSLLKKLIPQLRHKGLGVAVIKHAHHNFEIDLPGKDSYELRKAGASQVLISSAKRFVTISELTQERPLKACLNQVDRQNCDLILIEGYKQASIPKIELHRPAMGLPLLCRSDANIIAVASDAVIEPRPAIPVLDLNNTRQIAEFIEINIVAG